MSMTLAERFQAAVTDSYSAAWASSEMIPMVLSQACVAVLPVAGAGLSLTDELRVPLGASSLDAAKIERLQTTLGEGPCLAATAHHEPFVADLSTIAARWPMFHHQMTTQTPYQSVVSFPLHSRQHSRVGALDLYFTTPTVTALDSLAEVTLNIADPIAAVVFDLPPSGATQDLSLPPWLNTAPATDRMHVWIAIGMLIEHGGLTNADALAALRGYSFSHDTTLDDTAERLVAAQLSAQTVLI